MPKSLGVVAPFLLVGLLCRAAHADDPPAPAPEAPAASEPVAEPVAPEPVQPVAPAPVVPAPEPPMAAQPVAPAPEPAPPVAPAPQPMPSQPTAPAAPPEEPRVVSSWYGWQNLTADLASAGVLGAGLLSWTVEPTAIGYASYLLATPVVHGFHGRGGRAIGSFLMRLLIPVVAGGVGLGITVATHATEIDDLKAKTLATGGGIGMAAGAGFCTLIDTIFASETVKESAPSTGALRITPVVSSSHVGLGGTF